MNRGLRGSSTNFKSVRCFSYCRVSASISASLSNQFQGRTRFNRDPVRMSRFVNLWKGLATRDYHSFAGTGPLSGQRIRVARCAAKMLPPETEEMVSIW